MNETVVVAIGGNAITREGQRGTMEEQLANIRACCDPVVDLLEAGCRVVLTHGNGPQVGGLLLQNEAARDCVPTSSLDVCVAQTQGGIGYLLTQCLRNRIRERGLRHLVAGVLTQVEVDPGDPAFASPTKPVGPFYTLDEAERLRREEGYILAEDAGRGWRKVVPSPMPRALVERSVIRTLTESGFLVVAGGGGGIPVVREGESLHGVEAVIDKDYASALIASEIGAGLLFVLTGVDQVSVDFGKPTQRALERLSVTEARRYLEEGQFPAGSMGPKMDAVCRFVESGGGRAIITSIGRIRDALEGRAGTLVTASL